MLPEARRGQSTRVFPDYVPGWDDSSVGLLPGKPARKGDPQYLYSSRSTRPMDRNLANGCRCASISKSCRLKRSSNAPAWRCSTYHAELRNYAVIGTPNKNEPDLGFFVKYGDGGVDVNPIIHLFKTRFISWHGTWACRRIQKAHTDERHLQRRQHPGGILFSRTVLRFWTQLGLDTSTALPAKRLPRRWTCTEQVERVIADITRVKSVQPHT